MSETSRHPVEEEKKPKFREAREPSPFGNFLQRLKECAATVSRPERLVQALVLVLATFAPGGTVRAEPTSPLDEIQRALDRPRVTLETDEARLEQWKKEHEEWMRQLRVFRDLGYTIRVGPIICTTDATNDIQFPLDDKAAPRVIPFSNPVRHFRGSTLWDKYVSAELSRKQDIVISPFFLSKRRDEPDGKNRYELCNFLLPDRPVLCSAESSKDSAFARRVAELCSPESLALLQAQCDEALVAKERGSALPEPLFAVAHEGEDERSPEEHTALRNFFAQWDVDIEATQKGEEIDRGGIPFRVDQERIERIGYRSVAVNGHVNRIVLREKGNQGNAASSFTRWDDIHGNHYVQLGGQPRAIEVVPRLAFDPTRVSGKSLPFHLNIRGEVHPPSFLLRRQERVCDMQGPYAVCTNVPKERFQELFPQESVDGFIRGLADVERFFGHAPGAIVHTVYLPNTIEENATSHGNTVSLFDEFARRSGSMCDTGMHEGAHSIDTAMHYSDHAKWQELFITFFNEGGKSPLQRLILGGKAVLIVNSGKPGFLDRICESEFWGTVGGHAWENPKEFWASFTTSMMHPEWEERFNLQIVRDASFLEKYLRTLDTVAKVLHAGDTMEGAPIFSRIRELRGVIKKIQQPGRYPPIPPFPERESQGVIPENHFFQRRKKKKQ